MRLNTAENNLVNAFTAHVKAAGIVERAKTYLKLMHALDNWSRFFGLGVDDKIIDAFILSLEKPEKPAETPPGT